MRVLSIVLDNLFWLAVMALFLGAFSYILPIILRHKSRLTSDVSLIDASFDPNDSDYEEIKKDGKNIIKKKNVKSKND